MSEDDVVFYVGDPWFVTAEVDPLREQDKGKVPGEVKGVVYSPAEWLEKERGATPAGKAVAFEKLSESAVGSKWEALAVASLPEEGIWRIVVSSTAPLKGVEPDLITVQPLSAY